MLRVLDDASQTVLEERGYLYNYTLYPLSKGYCHRTAVAVRTQTLSTEDWNLFFLGETPSIGEVRDEELANEYIAKQVLRPYLKEAERTLWYFESEAMRVRVGVERTVWEMLKRRWIQIKELLQASLDKIK